MSALRVLVACECSGTVRDAFAAEGFEPKEIRPVAGFPNYMVTDTGEVITLHGAKPRLLAQSTDGKGYRAVSLRHNRKGRSFRVHRIVAEAFIPNPSNFPVVRHKDGNPANNRKENLEWGTFLENEQDKRRHGTWDLRRNGKLTLEDRQVIRSLSDEGWSQKALAQFFDVSRPTITRLLNGTIWGTDSTS